MVAKQNEPQNQLVLRRYDILEDMMLLRQSNRGFLV